MRVKRVGEQDTLGLHPPMPERTHVAVDVAREDRRIRILLADEQSLYNPRLKRRYAVRDDIPIMLIDEAEAVDDAEHERLIAKAEAEGITPTFEA